MSDIDSWLAFGSSPATSSILINAITLMVTNLNGALEFLRPALTRMSMFTPLLLQILIRQSTWPLIFTVEHIQLFLQLQNRCGPDNFSARVSIASMYEKWVKTELMHDGNCTAQTSSSNRNSLLILTNIFISYTCGYTNGLISHTNGLVIVVQMDLLLIRMIYLTNTNVLSSHTRGCLM